MITKLYLFIAACFCTITVLAQKDPTAVLAEAKRKMDSLMKNDPNIKKYAGTNNQANNTVNIPTSIPTINPYAKKPDTAFLSHLQFPDRDIKALATIPVKPMTTIQLTGFIGDMKKRVMTAMGSSANSQFAPYSTVGANGLSNASVFCWYAGDADKALVTALAAAEKDPGNLNVLNNLSGILTLCGVPYKAVPILDYIDERDPGNSTVDNNRGQAYLLMGDLQKAQTYLKKAVSESRYHPEANYMLACIEYKNGNKAEAQKYCENCLRGGFIGNAWTMLKAINPKAKLMELIKERYKQPDFFNPHKYPLPEQCKSADQVERLTVVYREFKNMLFAVGQKYRGLYKTEADYVSKNMPQQMMKAVSERRMPFRPFGSFAVVVLGDIEESYGETYMRLQKYDSTYFQRMKDLKDRCTEELKKTEESFKERADRAGEGNADMQLEADICKAKNDVANKYLVQFAALTEDRQRQWINQTKDYFNDYAFWCYVASIDDHQYHQMFYSLIGQYLTMLSKLANTELIYCKAAYSYTDEKSAEPEFKEGECPFKANINVEVEKIEENGEVKTEKPAKFEIDCENFSGELELSKEVGFHFKTTPAGRTTLAFSAGLEGDNKESKIGKYLPVTVGGEMQFGIVFGGGQPVDVNIKWDYNMKLPVLGKNSAGWSVSMINGAEFHGDGKVVNTTSSLVDKALGLQPPARQVNPNIKMFNH